MPHTMSHKMKTNALEGYPRWNKANYSMFDWCHFRKYLGYTNQSLFPWVYSVTYLIFWIVWWVCDRYDKGALHLIVDGCLYGWILICLCPCLIPPINSLLVFIILVFIILVFIILVFQSRIQYKSLIILVFHEYGIK